MWWEVNASMACYSEEILTYLETDALGVSLRLRDVTWFSRYEAVHNAAL